MCLKGEMIVEITVPGKVGSCIRDWTNERRSRKRRCIDWTTKTYVERMSIMFAMFACSIGVWDILGEDVWRATQLVLRNE
jgi:hypothetical protein